jgi:hypothetical protein
MFLNSSAQDWYKVPRDLETIWRSLQRKIIGLDNKSSFPLISGDTFKYMCDVIIEGQIKEGEQGFFALRELRGALFVQAEPMSNATRLIVQACKSGISFPYADLVIHNGDVIPNPADMGILSNCFKKIYSVNWLGDTRIASPLPIGLENRDKRRNGVPRDYLKEAGKGLPGRDQRDILLLVAFSLETNFKERSLALNYAREIPGVKIVSNPITPKQYRKLVLRSQFVLSPPGNGPDCHRTWESLYLGATPIVHRESWPFPESDIPVLVVNSWDEIRAKIANYELKVNDTWRNISNWVSL